MLSLLINLILSLILGQNSQQALVAKVPVLELAETSTSLVSDKGAVLDSSGRNWLYSKEAEAVQPIASISKLMTALVFLEHNPGWETTYSFTAADNVAGGRLAFFPGDEASLEDIFKASLVASDNGATIALVHASGLSEEEFSAAMNAKAQALGLKQTKFSDATGLSDKNVSTAREVAIMAREALSHREIAEATSLKEYRFQTVGGRDKYVESTDYLLFDSEPQAFSILGGKTGYTDEAGYCFVGRFRDQASGQEIISAVLGSAGKNERFRESKALANWIFSSYHPRILGE